MYSKCIVILVLTGVISCKGVPKPFNKKAIECDSGVGSDLEVCPGIGSSNITKESCLMSGCCWIAESNMQQHQCFSTKTRDRGDEFDLKINNEYHEVVQEEPEPPYYKIDLAGDFYSYTREEFSPHCTQELGSVMVSKAQSMISPVNTRIGVEFCLGKTTEDIRVVSISSSLNTDGIEGVATNSFIMRIAGNQTIKEVYTCATEISGYLEDHLNWGVPILPPPPGCPLPVFYSNSFTNIGNNWICLNSINTASLSMAGRLPRLAENALGYELTLEGDFVTYNGIPMEPQCTAAYSNQFLQETLQIMTRVNALIGNQLCSDYPGMVLSTATSGLSSDGHLGYTRSSFVASLHEDMYFDWVYACSEELSTYLQDYVNWGTPILDQIPGCPIVIFQGNGFEDTEQAWICL